MAGPTNKELQEKLADALEENQRLKDAGLMDLSEYTDKIAKLEKENEKKKNEIEGLKENWARELREREVLDHDAKQKEKQETLPFQTEHTRFRLLPRPYLRDIFGDVGKPVFNMGVTLDHYSGYVDIPMDVVIEAAQSIGMLTIDQAEDLQKDLEVEKSRNEAAGRLGTVLADGIHSLIDEFNTGLAAIDRTSLEEKRAGEADSEADSGSDGENDKSDSGEGSGSVSDDSADSESDGNADGPELDLEFLND